MKKVRKLINDYGQIIDFNRQLASFLLGNESFFKKHNGRNYSDKTLLDAMPGNFNVNIGIKLKKMPITLVETKESGTVFIFNAAEVHCIADDDEYPFFGFSIKLLLGSGSECFDFTIAHMNDYKIKPVRLNHKKKMISDSKGRLVIFSSKKDFEKVIDFCQQKIQYFNEHLPTDNQLVVNVNF